MSDESTIAITVMRGRDAGVHCDGQAHFTAAAMAIASSCSARRCRARFLHPEGHDYFAHAAREAPLERNAGALERNPGRSASVLTESRRSRFPPVDSPCSARWPSAISSSSTRSMSSSTPGFTVLTGETGAGKSILLDALGLLLGDRFELRPVARRRRACRARRDVRRRRRSRRRARGSSEHELAADGDEVLLRRVLDAQGKQPRLDQRPSRHARAARRRWASCWSTSTASMRTSRSAQPEAQRSAGRRLRRIHRACARRGRDAGAHGATPKSERDAAAQRGAATATEREFLDSRRRELAALAVSEAEWTRARRLRSRDWPMPPS